LYNIIVIEIKKSSSFSISYKLIRFLVILISLPFVKKINGAENLLREGPFIIAANHASHIDWIFFFPRFTAIIKRHIHTFAQTKYYNSPLFRAYVNGSQGIWVDPNITARSLLTGVQYLKHGEPLATFPEGTRSPDGKIRKGNIGTAILILQAKVPLVPVGLVNTHKVLPKGAAFPRFARCEANIGKLIKFDSFYKDYDDAINQNNREKIREIEEKVTQIIMKEIARLSNQEYPY